MHKVWGAQGGFDPDGKFYDVVIPNYLKPDDYPFQRRSKTTSSTSAGSSNVRASRSPSRRASRLRFASPLVRPKRGHKIIASGKSLCQYHGIMTALVHQFLPLEAGGSVPERQKVCSARPSTSNRSVPSPSKKHGRYAHPPTWCLHRDRRTRQDRLPLPHARSLRLGCEERGIAQPHFFCLRRRGL